jgi:hypothetical protein
VSSRNAAALLLCLAALACRETPDPAIAPGRLVRRQPGPVRTISALVPSEARAGEVFQRQPDGRAALAVLGTGLAQGDEIFWDGRRLPTTYGHSRILTATLPAELLAEPGDIEVTIRNAADPSKTALRATFRLRPADAPEP